jgi:antitoxin MazE
MPLVKVKKHAQITIPTGVRLKFNIAEGDYLEIEEHDDKIVLRPAKGVRENEPISRTRRVQVDEAEADRFVVKSNQVHAVAPADETLTALKAAKG